MIDLIMFLFGRIWIWELWIWKAISFKWGIMSHPSRNMEVIDAEGLLNGAYLAQEVSVEKNFRMWHKDFLWYFGEECGYSLPLSEKSAES